MSATEKRSRADQREHSNSPGRTWDCQQIRTLAGDLPAVWQAATTTDADRKQLMRPMIEKIHVTVVGESERVTVQITWVGGHRTGGEVVRPVGRLGQLS
ncbi:hypothetical protein [Streptomyces sp. NPDC006668]|uniref:hypothetical protein n=1 Tax=Streptomyces sp. NPDC006668 TaxID=3156903 RepID=UPI003404D4CE